MNKIIKFLKVIKGLISGITALTIMFTIFIFVPIYVVYALIFEVLFPPKHPPMVLEAQDMNPIKAPRSSRYQIESTGFQFLKGRLTSATKGGSSWYYILDSKGYCYGMHAFSGENNFILSDENNMKLFGYISQKSPSNPSGLIQLDNFKLLYLRGTLQHSSYGAYPRLKETVEEQRKAMLPEYFPKRSEWDCTKQMPSIDIIEIKYEYNNQIYHFKINDELEKQFQQDLVYTFN